MIWLLIDIVTFVIQLVAIGIHAHLYRKNTANYARWGDRAFIRLRRFNVAAIVWCCFWMAWSVIGVALGLHILRLGA